MAIKTALQLREARGKKKVEPRYAVTFTLEEAKLVHLAVKAWKERTNLFKNEAESASAHLDKVLKRIEPLGSTPLRPTPQGRKSVCSGCAFSLVEKLGDLCP